jgi:outer membrane lipoprotein SlyB
MSSKPVLVFLAASAASLFAGCATASKTPVYDSTQVGQMISEERGEVIAVQDVVIKARSSQAGSPGVGSRMGAAAATSAILGSPIHAAIAAGEMIGGIAGASADNKNGEELTILLKDGRTVMVVQERGETPFSIGERVKIVSGSSSSIYGGANTRVVHDETSAKSF